VLVGEQGGLEFRIGHKVGVMAVLLRELIAAMVENILKVYTDRQWWDSIPTGTEVLAFGKAEVWWHKQTKGRHLVHERYCQGAWPQYRHWRFVTIVANVVTTTTVASSYFVAVHHL
jgi:hypothetical protein